MDIHNLVGLANRIGDFFQSMPDRAEAKHDIALHISKFWAPRMREALIAQLGNASTAQLHSLVRDAVQENLALLATQRAQR